MKDTGPLAAVRVWDAPVRVFHWLLVACFVVAWLTRDARRVDPHAAAGYAMLGLVAFRAAWGLAGTRTARFADFVASPLAALRYLRQALRRQAPPHDGHNPAGGWSILGLLALAGLSALSGLCLLAARHGLGPLGGTLSPAGAGTWHALHEAAAWAMLGLVALHLGGVALGCWSHRENLVAAMISGRKRRVRADAPAVASHRGAALLLALAVAAGCAAYLAATGWWEGYDGLRRAARQAGAGPPAPWGGECGSCHLAYPPELLPAASWRRMLAEQDRHFGEDLGLDAESVRALLRTAEAAGAPRRWAGLALREGLAPGAAPQRITETAFWRARHRDIPAARFRADAVRGRHNCEACHGDAASAIFSPRLIHIPE